MKKEVARKASVRKTKGKPNSMDEHVGTRLRVRRTLAGLSQEKLAQAVGLTFQQIQKYERGTNRVSAGRLHDFARVLEVPVTYFFEHFTSGSKSMPLHLRGLSDTEQQGFSATEGVEEDPMSRRETLELIKIYHSVSDPAQRRKILRALRAMAEEANESKSSGKR